MILRPAATDNSCSELAAPRPAWDIIEESQRACAARDEADCWLVTQPSHAALSGEIAASMAGPRFPGLDPQMVQAIALHDAGWTELDVEVVRDLRTPAGTRQKPRSFITFPPADYLRAWTASIATAAKVSPAGAYLVSRHFCRLAESALARNLSAADAASICAFLQVEGAKQQAAQQRSGRLAEELESLVEVLRFCDLLSLYFCCGATQAAEFPACLGPDNARHDPATNNSIILRLESSGFVLTPTVFAEEQWFEFAAIRAVRSQHEAGAADVTLVVK